MRRFFRVAGPVAEKLLEHLWQRCSSFLDEPAGHLRLAVSHGGWIAAAARMASGQGGTFEASSWPAAVNYGVCIDLRAT